MEQNIPQETGANNPFKRTKVKYADRIHSTSQKFGQTFDWYCTHTHTYTHTHTHTHRYTYTYTHRHTYRHTNTHIHTHTNTHTQTHIHTHTRNTQIGKVSRCSHHIQHHSNV